MENTNRNLREETTLPEETPLPDEMLIEVFSRLPHRSVGKCRCLSTLWRRNLSTSQFVHSHLKRQIDQKVAILVTVSSDLHTIKIPVDGSDEVVSRELDIRSKFRANLRGSCNGLIMVSHTMKGTSEGIRVVNPLTLQQVTIPYAPVPVEIENNQVYRSHWHGFGYDSRSDDYKIVTLTVNSLGTTFVHVFSLKSFAWRRVGDSPYVHDSFYAIEKIGWRALGSAGDNGVFLNGAIHWFVVDRCVIAAFDLHSESFNEFLVPDDPKLRAMICKLTLFEMSGCLVLIDTLYPSTWNMWVLKEYGQVNSWTHFSCTGRGEIEPMCFIGESEAVFLIKEKGDILMWNLTEGTTRTITADLDLSDHCGMNMFVESLVSPIQNDKAFGKGKENQVAGSPSDFWAKPSDGCWLTLNTAGRTYMDSCSSFVGGLCRNEKGRNVWCFKKEIPFCTTYESEAKALLLGLQYAWERRIPRLAVHVESSVIVKLLGDEITTGVQEFDLTIEECKRLVRMPWSLHLMKIAREFQSLELLFMMSSDYVHTQHGFWDHSLPDLAATTPMPPPVADLELHAPVVDDGNSDRSPNTDEGESSTRHH